MTHKLVTSIFILFLILNALPSQLFAQGDLMVLPKRLVFDGTQRSHEINLANTGNDTAIYAISFIQYKMTETGSFEEIVEAEEGQNFADGFLRYYPRRVTLAPNEAQTVRVRLTRTGNLDNGEYRSHIYFRAVEDQIALGEEQNNDTEGISINIKTVFGISIPVIIRQGESNTQVKIENITLDTQTEKTRLSIDLIRSGNMSVYGDIKAEHISPTGISTEVGIVKGVSVYTPNQVRKFSFELKKTENVDFQSGKLLVTYTSDKGQVLTTSSIELN